MGNSAVIRVFFAKNFKENSTSSFFEKVKIVKTYIPEKVKFFIENNFNEKESNYFQKKYSVKIEFISNDRLIIPEYKIELLNKSKKY